MFPLHSSLCLLLLACDEGGKGSGPPEASDTADTGSSTGTDTGTDSAETGEDTDTPPPTDADGDGYAAGVDCDDANSDIHPGAAEICTNNVDDNCDGSIHGCQGEISTEAADGVFVGDSPDDGAYPIGVGDVDTDGVDELIVSSFWNINVGTPADGAFVLDTPFYGQVDVSDSVSNVRIGTAERIFNKAAVGDLDGDGQNDLALASGFEAGSSSGYPDSFDGAVFVFEGPMESSVGIEHAFLTVIGPVGNTFFGISLALADVTGEGHTDLVVGAYAEAQVWVFPNPEPGAYTAHGDGWELSAEADDNNAGLSLHVTDYNGDGLSDLITPASGYQDEAGARVGAVYILHGPVTGDGSLDDADALCLGYPESFFGSALDVADADGDGYPDLLIGSPYNSAAADRAGAAWLVTTRLSGPTLVQENAGATFTGDTSMTYLGYDVAMGDVDGDNVADILLAAPSIPGDVYMFWSTLAGAFSSIDSDIRFRGGPTDASLGTSVSIGYLDEDALGDPIIYARNSDLNAEDAGASYIFYESSLK